MKTSYETDVVAWANEQAALIRAGSFDQLDLTHIAEEIEDVGKSEQRELASRMAVLLMHLLKLQYQPTMQSKSWQRTIKEQRRALHLHIKSTPSLQTSLANQDWVSAVYADSVSKAIDETGIDTFPEDCPWAMSDVLTENWFPK
jgi:hypothetical protein